MKHFALLYILFIPFLAIAQDPGSIKWKQINTDVFQIIYPENYDSAAFRIGSFLQTENEYETYTMKRKPKPISIVLHNQLTMSNSWVALAPRRMELFHTPPQTSISPMDWNAALALHEYRHVIQYEMLKEGFAGKLLFILSGDGGLGLKSVTTPDWFYEGDAVATETSLSKAGRGRSPDFSKDLRAQLLEKQKYTYGKAVCGSYKDYVPNHYVLGYHLVSYGRFVWSADLWRIAHQNSGNTFGLMPFSSGIKMVTGMRKYQFYNLAMSDLKTYWTNQLKSQKLLSFNTVNIPSKSTYTDYTDANRMDDKSIIALKSGMGDIPTIVRINNDGTETMVHEVASMIDGNPINTNGSKIIWTEGFPDVRWSNRSYADIMIYDIDEKSTYRFSHKQHYYAPDISEDGTKIITVEVSEKAKYNLVILDAKNGAIIKKIQAPKGEFILTPHWANNNSTVTCILLGKAGKFLTILNTETGTFTNCSQPMFTDISEPFFYKKYIFYTSEHNGINNEIYAYDTILKKSFQITNTKFGCRFASINRGEILFSTYTSDGYSIGSIPFDEREWTKSDFTPPPTDSLVLGLIKDEKGIPNLFDSTKTYKYTAEPYHKILHIISPYAWGVGINTNNNDAKTKENDVSIFSQDKLGTFAIQAGYKYDYIGTKYGYATIFYTGMYPVIQLDYQKGTYGILTSDQKKQKTLDYDTLIHEDQSLFRQMITFPFNLSTSNYSRIIQISGSNIFNHLGDEHLDIKGDYQFHVLGSDYHYVNKANASYQGYTDYINLTVSFSNVKASSSKDIQPSWAQTFQAGFDKYLPILDYIKPNSLNGTFSNYVDLAYVKGSLYIPGLFKYHGIKLTGGYSQAGNVTENNMMSYNPISLPILFARGYIDYTGNDSKYYGSFSANYAFPLINPDFSIPSLVYLKQITANIFYDYSFRNYSNKKPPQSTTYYSSFGIELVSENYVMNIRGYPLYFGFRFSSIDPEVGQTKRRIIVENLLSYSF
jgi:hypothetical protein